MKIIFCGDRKWQDRDLVTQVMSAIKANIGEFVVIEGGAKGADAIAHDAAKHYVNLPFETYDAQWTEYGKAAGPIRNREMLINGQADAVVAFHNDIQSSKGTANMVTQARKAAKPVWISSDGPEKLLEFIIQLKKLRKGKL